MSYESSYRYMPKSPGGHEIEKISGDAGTIAARGIAIASLGEQMLKAATTLKLLAGEQVGKGQSLDSVKDQAEEVHSDLRKAGERYQPSGEILSAYAAALSTAQITLNAVVDNCGDLWDTVQGKAAGADQVDNAPLPDASSPAAAEDAREQALGAATGKIDTAYSAWETEASSYDAPYETWSDAYESAVSGLQKVNEDGVSDGFWDDILPAVEILLQILEVLGVVLALAAIIIGGPILAAIAAVVAVIALVATLILFFKGRKDGKDLAFAILGVIPFGKFAKLANVSDVASSMRFPRLATLAGVDDFSAAAKVFGRVGDDARALWSGMRGARGLPYEHLSVGTWMALDLRAGATYFVRNLELPSSYSMVLNRMAGLDGPATSVLEGLGGMGTALFGTVFPTLSLGVDTGNDIATDNRVESWRSN